MIEHFIIAGAQRSGTTAVYHLLDQHPDICMATPVRPEPKFFLDPVAVRAGYETYLSRYFSHRRNQRLLGEKSTSYIERYDAIERIHEMLPEAKLIFVLRDPVMRAWSNWRFSRAHGLETLDFDAALDAEKSRLQNHHSGTVSVNPFAYAARGHYVRYLDRWAQHFDPGQITIVVSERIFEDTEHIRSVYARLGVRTDCELQSIGCVNTVLGERTPPSATTQARLRQEFAQDTLELHDRWHVDVSGWLR